MAEKLLIDAHYKDETRIAIIDNDGKLENFEAEHSRKKPIKGNIYLAKIARIETSIQAAFIDYGAEKHGFLPLSEIHADYFKDIAEEELSVESPEEEGESTEDPGKKKRKIYRIQDVMSNKQVVLVQAEKEVRGNKCASFTTFISIPGRYCVLMPNSVKGKTGGVSKKLDSSEKDRLREIINDLEIPEGMGCIVRTAGKNRTKQEIKRDFEYLLRVWAEIKEKVESSAAPSLVYEEGNIVKRTIRDLYNRTTEKIIIQGAEAYKEARTFMKLFTPSHVKKIELYSDEEIPIFHKYEVEEKISGILDPTVVLPSGGTIVINQTEALTAIDVNSGKMRNELALEDTAVKTNLEAASEIAKQIKLRDIAGIIVIDFIDMLEHNSTAKVEKKFRDAVKNDYSSIQIGKISQFGLLEVSRQRLRVSLTDSNFVPCKHCGGSGRTLSNDTAAFSVLRKIETFLVKEKAKSVLAEVAPGVDLFVLNSKKRLLLEMEETYGTLIEIVRNVAVKPLDCRIIVKEYLTPVKATEAPKQRDPSKKKVAKPVVEPITESKQEKQPIPKNNKPQRHKRPQNHDRTATTETATIPPVVTEEKLVNKTNIKAAVVVPIAQDAPQGEIKEQVAKKRRRRRKPKNPRDEGKVVAQTSEAQAQSSNEQDESKNGGGWLKKIFG